MFRTSVKIAIWPADLGKNVIILLFRHCLIEIPDWIETVCSPQFLRDWSGIEVEYLLSFYEALSNLLTLLADDPILSLAQVSATEGSPPWKIEDRILRIWWQSLQLANAIRRERIFCQPQRHRHVTLKWTKHIKEYESLILADCFEILSNGPEVWRGGGDRQRCIWYCL